MVTSNPRISKNCVPGCRASRTSNSKVPSADFEFVADELHLLDALEQLAVAHLAPGAFGQSVLLQLIEHVAAAREIAQKNALAIADGSGLVCSYVDESLRTALTWTPPLCAKALWPTYG